MHAKLPRWALHDGRWPGRAPKRRMHKTTSRQSSKCRGPTLQESSSRFLLLCSGSFSGHRCSPLEAALLLFALAGVGPRLMQGVWRLQVRPRSLIGWHRRHQLGSIGQSHAAACDGELWLGLEEAPKIGMEAQGSQRLTDRRAKALAVVQTEFAG